MNGTHVRTFGRLVALLAIVILAAGALAPGVAYADDPSYPVPGFNITEPDPGQFITDVKVVTGDSSDIQCPAGYAKRYPDLNMGSGGDFVYTCLKFGTDASQGIGELYISSNDSVACDANGREDQEVDGDLNSGVVNAFGFDHQSLFYCIHRPGTTGGSARIPHPGEGYNTYFPTPDPASGKLLHDVQFLAFDAGHLPGCVSTDCVDTSPVGAFAYLTAAVTIDPYCQRYFGSSYHPLFQPWEYFLASGDRGADVPQDAQVFDTNAGSLGKPLIYACGSYMAPDTTPPTVTASAATADGQPYIAGVWANQTVTVTFTCADNPGGSGVAQVTAPIPFTNDNIGSTPTGICWDVANNYSEVSFGPVLVDKSKPAVSASATTADGQPYLAGTWTNQDVTVSFTCADAVSGVASDTVAGATLTADGANQSVTSSGSCADVAGNVAAAVSFGPINIDKTKPVITASATTADGDAYSPGAWTNKSVEVDFACDDALSGVVASGLGGVTLPTEGDNQYVTNAGSCVDNAGNAADPATYGPIKIDKTKPIITASATTAAGQSYTPGDWTNQDVTVAFACADTGATQAGIAVDTLAGATLNADGADLSVTNTGACVDQAGNAADAVTLGGIMIDKTAPQIAITSPSATTYLLNQAATVDYACADLLAGGATPGSGVAACAGSLATGDALDTATVGAHTFTVSAQDAVGNVASLSVSYTVAYDICPLYDQTKAHKAGSAVPIKLELCDAAGANVSSAESVVTAMELTQVGTAATATPIAAGNANPDNAFRYADDGYIYNLKTTGLSAGTWELRFTVARDPTTHTVQFQVR